ncbi:MAG: DUF5703 domain-containing protein, partial [Solirubrobacterales bacterium]
MTARTLILLVSFVLTGAGWAAQPNAPAEVYVVPNFHPASCGWLTDWSTERNYCANSYLDHLDRVRDDPNYAFALSECNTMIAILNFHPDRVAELKQRIREGRVDLVNAFFLEPTINLSGGEALVKMGVEGIRWQQAVFGVRPRFVWAIDVTGVHEQMAQITSGLGLDAMVYTRDNPTGKSIHWLQAPDGSRCLAISPGHYADWDPVFRTPTPLDSKTLAELLDDVKTRIAGTPKGAPVLVLGGAGDYSLAPACKEYPSAFLRQWKGVAPQTAMHFTGPGRYVDAILPGVQSGRIELPVSRSGARLSWTSFWIESPKVKQWYRRAEQGLQAAEMLATIASRDGKFDYPAQSLYHAWLQMLLNMDRNTLWGAAGGMVFEHEKSWDVRDRFESVEKISAGTARTALEHVSGRGRCLALFNPLNWQRTDPVQISLPTDVSPVGVTSQAVGNGQILCRAPLPSTGVLTLAASNQAVPASKAIGLPPVIETNQYRARIDPNNGALCSLKLKSSDREILAGPVLLVAEQAGDFHSTPRRDQRKRLADSSQIKPRISVTEGPLATIVRTDTSLLGSVVRQTVYFYKDSPRIDFGVELNDVPDKTIVLAEFPLAEAIQETRRGIPYGFSHAAWEKKDSNLAGFGDGILAAIRWSHYQFDRAGVAILDRGLPGRELTGRTPVLFLLDTQEIYMGYRNAWLSGKSRQSFSFALVAHDGDWKDVRIPQMAWEFNSPPVVATNTAEASPQSFLQTSDNVIVEAMRREGNEIEVRLAECLGVAGTAELTLNLPHGKAAITDLTGGRRQPLEGGPTYRLPVRPQQIVTLRFDTDQMAPAIQPLTKWDPLVPQAKLAALNTKLDKKGHPPAGDQQDTLPADAAKSMAKGKPATASNVYQNQDGCRAELAFDGDPQTRWASDAGVQQAWLEVDLGRACTIDRAWLSEAYDRIEEFELQADRNGRWETFARGGKIGAALELKFAPVQAQRVRLNVLKATDGPTIWEFLLFEAASPISTPYASPSSLDSYNVTWDSPSVDHHGSMPLGNGDIALNAWVTPAGDIQFLIGKSDAWDDNGRMVKVGAVRVHLEPNPFEDNPPFRQTLSLRDATLKVQAGDGPRRVGVRVWVDANHPVVHVA